MTAFLFSIILKEGEKQEVVEEVHLTAKQQYLKLVEEYPLVKELKERLSLENLPLGHLG